MKIRAYALLLLFFAFLLGSFQITLAENTSHEHARDYTTSSLAYQLYTNGCVFAMHEKYVAAAYLLKAATRIRPDYTNSSQILRSLGSLQTLSDRSARTSELLERLNDPIIKKKEAEFHDKYKVYSGLTIDGVPLLRELDSQYQITNYFKKNEGSAVLKEEVGKFFDMLKNKNAIEVRTEYDRLINRYPRATFQKIYIQHLIENDRTAEAKLETDNYKNMTGDPLATIFQEYIRAVEALSGSGPRKEEAEAELSMKTTMYVLLQVIGNEARSPTRGT